MKNRIGRNVAVDLLACLGASYILLLTAILIVPRFIDRVSIGDKLCSEVSKLVNGEFNLKCRDPSLFPMPPVLLADETSNLMQRITSSAQVIEVYLCAIKFAAGTLESKPIEEILLEFKGGLSQGHRLFTLIAGDTGCYGIDIGTSAVDLLIEIF
jgi:hypothetical protein